MAEEKKDDGLTTYGTFTVFDGTYTGEWRDGAPNGQGVLTTDDGDVYEGTWCPFLCRL